MRLVFRTDASLTIGSGHVMRCLTLAEALRTRGAQCFFVCREHPGNLLELIRKRGFEACALHLNTSCAAAATVDAERPTAHAAWLGAHWRTDAAQTLAACGGSDVDWLIVDHYALDARWEAELRPACRKLMVIDDLADRNHDCDLLLDQNLVAESDARYQQRVPPGCTLLLGPRYALLQPLYRELRPQARLRPGPGRP